MHFRWWSNLVADSSQSTGLKWATASSGGSKTLLSTTTLSGASTTISSIDQTYVDLCIEIYGVNPNNSAAQDFWVGMNGVYTGTNIALTGNGSALDNNSTGQQWVTKGTAYFAASNTTNHWTCIIPQYASSTISKFMTFNGFFTGTVATQVVTGVITGSSTSAVTSLGLKLSSGTSFSGGTVLVYGVK